MKTFELKKKSWHYFLANFGSERVYSHTDICAYIRYVIYGTFWFIIMGGAGAFFSGCVLFSIGNLFSWLFLGYELEKMTVGVFTMFSAFFMMGLFLVGKDTIQHKMRDGEPGFVRLAYRSWKDKFCAKVELK